MANQRDLKAFVRYDGSGRVVAGSLVLRKKKPKVGRWQEILTYECCNPTTTTTTTAAPITTTTSSSTSSSTSTSTTTTTTTALPTTTTTTTGGVFNANVTIASSQIDACAIGSNASVIGNGTTLCNSTTFTSSYWSALSNGTYYIAFAGNVIPVNNTGGSFATAIGACSSC